MKEVSKILFVSTLQWSMYLPKYQTKPEYYGLNQITLPFPPRFQWL